MEAVECGAACLSMILGYHGRFVPLPQLRRDCGVSRDGSRASNIVSAAQSYGLKAKGLKKEVGGLKDLPYPYILFWNFNHFVVMEGFRKGQVYINDPAVGRRAITPDEFDESFTGVVLTMTPGEKFERGGAPKGILSTLGARLRGSYLEIFYCIAAGFLLVLPGLVAAALTQTFVDQVLIQQMQGWARPVIIGLVFAALLQALLYKLQFRALSNLRFRLSATMSAHFLTHLLELPISFYAQRYSGELSDRMRLNDRVATLLSGEIAAGFIGATMMVFYLAVMAYLDCTLAAIAAAVALCDIILLRAIALHFADSQRRLTLEAGKLNGVAIAGLQTIRVIKSSAMEADFFARLTGNYARYARVRQVISVPSKLMGVVPNLLTALVSALVLVVGGRRVIHGEMTIGMLLAFQSLGTSFLAPVNSLLRLVGYVQEIRGDIDRLDDALRNPVEPNLTLEPARDAPASRSAIRLEGRVEIRNLTFGYNRNAPPLVRDLNLILQPGQRVALVGGSGSGKSTIAKLIVGLYEPWSGEIRFDGMLRGEIERSVLANSLAFVDQDIFLFSGTVRDNLTLWDPAVPDSALRRACGDVALLEAVSALPGGFLAELNESGGNLSGGQRQRLEIGRALLTDPSILILDEATSALDPETEQELDRNIRRRGCTCVTVAHRLSTIRDCDEIIVLRRGEVMERGTHNELWRANGEYARLLSNFSETPSGDVEGFLS
jgi:NHLM bacteriocin system ABC transporter peptidase/ATP-binding protein